ncbi:MAG: pilus assembly protein N-terminal domain-containing protein [Terracidiphilus sp.]
MSVLIAALCAGQVAQAQATASSAPSAGAAFEDSTNELSVEVGKAVLVDTAQPIQRVALGTSDVADATTVSPTEIMITGAGAGATSLIIWDIRGGRQFFTVKVRPNTGLNNEKLEDIRREMRAELPGEPISISLNDGTVFLRGTAKNLASAARAVSIASSVGKVVNLLNVEVPNSDPQFLLKVRFLSVDREKAIQLGINLVDLGLGHAIGQASANLAGAPELANSGSTTSSSTTSGFAGSGGTALFGSEGNIFTFLPGLNVGASINALEQKSVLESLAEPNILAMNNRQASFLSGGEYPYPVVSGTSGGTPAVSIQFQEYGIRLNFIPTLTPRGTIRLQVAPEVSALDYANSVTISGFSVPGITSRKVNTEVELKDGQSFVIGGLLDNTISDQFQKIPFIGDIPILGKLFQSESKTKNNAELLVIVTPEIVSPLAADAKLPDLNYPDKKFLPPNSNIPMHQPDAKTADNTLPPPAPAVPVETLIDSMKPEKPLVLNGGTGFGSSAQVAPGGGGSTSSTGAGAPQQ